VIALVDRDPWVGRHNTEWRPTLALALAILATAGAASWPATESVSVEYPNIALKAGNNEVAVEGVIARARLQDASME
jgi:hypothetical protein